ncbi:hypothetical protein DQG13_04295 [Paenibacillus sp. YN15]|nr:hypothetical protein DQG13_04295 [Paenibacillus sp. YN15]
MRTRSRRFTRAFVIHKQLALPLKKTESADAVFRHSFLKGRIIWLQKSLYICIRIHFSPELTALHCIHLRLSKLYSFSFMVSQAEGLRLDDWAFV